MTTKEMERKSFKELRSSSELKNVPKIGERKSITVGGVSEKEKRFRVMQFNTLAMALSTPEVGNFEMLEKGALDWPFRRTRVAIQWLDVSCNVQRERSAVYLFFHL